MSSPLKELSDEEVLQRSRSIKHGSDAQRDAIAEARRRGIFDGGEHLESSPTYR